VRAERDEGKSETQLLRSKRLEDRAEAGRAGVK
jgi:hypothetical protein